MQSGINDGIDNEPIAAGRHLVFARQRHHGIGAHCDIAAAAQMGDNRGASPLSMAGLCMNDPHAIGIELERYFRVGQQTRSLTDCDGNGHLAFGRDTHRAPPLTLMCKSKML